MSRQSHDAERRTRAIRIANLAISALVALLWFQVLRPQFLGGPASYTVVDGTSMNPSLRDGDFALTQRAGAYDIGDVIAYRVPAGSRAAGLHVIHRVVGGNGETGYVTRGDNRSRIDPWRPRGDDVMGRVALRIPYVGRAVEFLRTGPMVAWMLGSLAIVAMWKFDRRRRPAFTRTSP